jgi:hypothetical protein
MKRNAMYQGLMPALATLCATGATAQPGGRRHRRPGEIALYRTNSEAHGAGEVAAVRAPGDTSRLQEQHTMQWTFPKQLTATLARCCAIAALTGLSLAAHAQPAGIAPEAQRLLKASTDFLASQKQFSAETRNTLEIVLKSGQKIEFNHTARMAAQRPNKLRAERTGDLVDQIFIYDGKSLTLHNPQEKVFAQVAAPDTLEGMLDFARTKLDIVAPAGDLLYKNAYDLLMDGVTDGFVVGKAVIEGVRCDHLAFRAPHVDLQVWIQEGAQPLPRKLVITTRDLPNAPQFAVTVTKWNLKPNFGPQTFSFTRTAGVKQVDFLPR